MTVKGGICDGKACLLRTLRGVISRFLCLLKAWASPEQCGQKYGSSDKCIGLIV